MSAPVTPSVNRYAAPSVAAALVTPTPIENGNFINSSAGRTARIVAEFTEFPVRVAEQGIRGTFLFFGSARAMSKEKFEETQRCLSASITLETDPAKRSQLEKKQKILESQEWMCGVYQSTEELARLLTEWALTSEGKAVGERMKTKFQQFAPAKQPLVVCTGGGPGFMEAGNKGAASVPDGVSMGVAVTLPFEAALNPYVTPGLNFRMEYFFTRKFWEVYAAKAMICAPGGMGTCDEMFEVLTLMQCGHCPKMPVVLLGERFWRECIQFEKFAAFGVISHEEVDNLCFTDDPLVAFNYIRSALLKELEPLRTSTPTPTAS